MTCYLRSATTGENIVPFVGLNMVRIIQKKSRHMASKRYHRNTISFLRDQDGLEVTDHQVMAGMFWQSFKYRMGQSEGIDMQCDLSILLVRTEGLEDLTLPFEKKLKWMQL
jgi:hypothetical protein